MSFTKSLIILLAAICLVNALATPHVHRSHHRRALASRASTGKNASNLASPAERRALRKRCRERPASSSLASSTSAPTSSAQQQSSTQQQLQPSSSSTSSTQDQQPTSTQEQQQPTTTSSEPQQQQPTSSEPQQQPTSTTQEQSQPTQSQGNGNTNNGGNSGSGSDSSDSSSLFSGQHTGEGTFYNTGLTACGQTFTDNDKIVAVSQLLFDIFPGYNGANPNNNPICGKKITAHYQGKSVDLTIVDRCTGCAITDIDMTPSAFDMLADEGLGRLKGVTWTWQ